GALSSGSSAPQRSHVTASQREPVGVVALEQQLRGAAADTERVAECSERDRVQPRQDLAPPVVQRGRHGEPVTAAAQPARLLEERGELLVVDLCDLLQRELRLQLRGSLLALAERAVA